MIFPYLLSLKCYYTYTDDYADDLAVVTDNIKDANTLLNKLEEVSKEIGLNINTAKTDDSKYRQYRQYE